MCLEKMLGKIGKEADNLIAKAGELTKDLENSEYAKNIKEMTENMENVFKQKKENIEMENIELKTMNFKKVIFIDLKKDFNNQEVDFSYSLSNKDIHNKVITLSVMAATPKSYETYSYDIDLRKYDPEKLTAYFNQEAQEVFIEIPKKEFLAWNLFFCFYFLLAYKLIEF